VSESACYRCPRCEQYVDVDEVDCETYRELSCPHCGQKVTMETRISVDYEFLVRHDYIDYNVSAESDDTGEHHILQDEEEWKEVHTLLNSGGGSE